MKALLLNCIFQSNKVSDIKSPYRFCYKLSNYFLDHNCSFHINICYIMTGLICLSEGIGVNKTNESLKYIIC